MKEILDAGGSAFLMGFDAVGEGFQVQRLGQDRCDHPPLLPLPAFDGR